MPVIYPEIVGDKVKIYMGSVESSEKYNTAAIGIAMLVGVTGFYLTGENMLFFLPGTQYTYTPNEKALGYLFFETKLNQNGELQENIPFKEQTIPTILNIKRKCWKMEEELEATCIMIYKNQGNFYGTYYSKSELKLLVRKIEID